MNSNRTSLWIALWTGGLVLAIGVIALIGPGSFAGNAKGDAVTGNPDVAYVLKTAIQGSRMVYKGAAGDIEGQTNPLLRADMNDVVEITLENGDGGTHDIALPRFGVNSDRLLRKGVQTKIVFRVTEQGGYDYFCTVSGHRLAGMEGRLEVGQVDEPVAREAPDISRDPADLPPPVTRESPGHVRFDLTAQEIEGQLDDGAVYTYFTFNGKVPGPFLRVRVGDQVEVHLANPDSNSMVHSIDLHAVTGPGGGSSVMQVPPGEEKSFTCRALKPGLFVYHCASPMVAHHIANGMYGMILVEPEDGLPPVDHEFYVMQQEIYTRESLGTKGILHFSNRKLLDGQPEYFVLNGSVGALTDRHPLRVKSGETARIFFGVGGPDSNASFHVIGEIMDTVYDRASLTSAPLRDVQTTTVAPGGATVAEITVQVPGTYKIVDHALSRMERGLVGHIRVTGPGNPEIFRSGGAASLASR
ncbi:MAG TPA: copper-containing nitrite reductase [bacterium]|nr:copper-containing nitrite reductase [bacterium]